MTEKPPQTIKSVGRTSQVIAAIIALTLLGIVLSRHYDGAQFHSARSGVEWTHHALRIELASELPGLHPLRARDWVLSADRDFPPLVPVVGALLGFVVGHGEEPIHRAGVLWLLLLALATGVLCRALSGDTKLALAAAVCSLLLPAHHAASLTFYFDLPMVALLWMGLATLASQQDAHPVRGGLAAGFLLSLAALAKWTALPLIPPLLLGVLLIRPEGRSWDRDLLVLRARAALPLVLLNAGLVLSFWRLSPRSWNRMLSMSFGGALDPRTDFTPTSWLHTVSATLGGLTEAITPGRHLSVEALYWYPLHFVWSYLSLPVAVALALLALLWLQRPDRSWPLIACACLGHLALLFGVFSSLDERFLLSLGPVVVLPPLMAWSAMPPKLRAVLGALIIGSALWVAFDFHHSTAEPGMGIGKDNPEATTIAGRVWGEIAAERQGIGLQSATDKQWGWMRSDAQRAAYFEARELLWGELIDCGASVVLAQEELTLDGFGEGFWWDFRRRLALLDNEAAPVSILGFADDATVLLSGTPTSIARAVQRDSVVAVTRYTAQTRWKELPLPQVDRAAPAFELRAIIDRRKLLAEGPELMDGPPLLALWTPPGSKRCSQITRDGDTVVLP